MTASIDDTSQLAVQIAQGDPSLFDSLPAQLETDDKRSFLALHAACRTNYGEFAYLEIGSHLGGSLQVLVRDPACRTILSIDPRPAWQPDQRGMRFGYPENSTKRMLSMLASVPQACVEKITTYDTTSALLEPTSLTATPQLCFIDGEHTDAAVLTDARFCQEAMSGRGCIVFHDSAVVYNGVAQFIEELDRQDTPYTAYFLPSMLFVVELGPALLRSAPQVTEMILANYRGYLFSLKATDPYRRFYTAPVFRRIRTLKALARRNPIFR